MRDATGHNEIWQAENSKQFSCKYFLKPIKVNLKSANQKLKREVEIMKKSV